MVFFILFLLLTLQIPFIQTKLVGAVSDKLSDIIGFDIQIERIYINWLDKSVIKGITVSDQQGNAMIRVEKLKVDFDLSSLLNRNTNIDYVIAEGGAVHLIVDSTTENLNITEFIDSINELIDDGDTTRSPNPAKFSIRKIVLKDLNFSYTDLSRPSITDRWDYYHFGFKKINADISNFWNRRDTISLLINKGNAVDRQYGTPLHHLHCLFRYTKQDMRFDGLRARFGESILKDTLVFTYKSTAEFSDFNEKINIYAHIDSSIIHTDDISIFAPELAEFGQKYYTKGIFKGRVSSFNLNNMTVKSQSGSILRGSLSMKGLPELDQTFVDLHLKQSRVNPIDVGVFAGKAAKEFVEPLGTFDLNGEYSGFFQNFAIRFTMFSNIGDLKGNAQFSFPEKRPVSYKGYFLSTGFDFGKLLKNENLGVFSLEGKVAGSGFEPKNIDLDLNATFGMAELYGFKLKKLRTVLNFQNEKIKGLVASRDESLELDGFAELDFGKSEHILFSGTVAKSRPELLGMPKGFSFFSGDCNIDLYGFDINRISGKADLRNIKIEYNKETLEIKSLKGRSEANASGRMQVLELESDFADMKLEGDFEPTILIEESAQLIGNYIDILQQNNNPRERIKYIPARADYTVHLKDINPVLSFFKSELYFSPNTKMNGEINIDEYALFVLDGEIDVFRAGEYTFENTRIDLIASKGSKSDDIVASLYIYSKAQTIGDKLRCKDWKLDIGWTNEKLSFSTWIDEAGDNIQLKIVGDAFFSDEEIDIRFKPGNITFVGNKWKLDNENKITLYRNGLISFDHITLSEQNQVIALTGIIGKDSPDFLNVKIQNFNLETINPLLDVKLEGTTNADLKLANLTNQDTRIEGQLTTTNLKVDNYLIGDLEGFSNYDLANNRVMLNVDLKRDSKKLLNVGGYYALNEEQPLNLDVSLDGAEFALIEPILKDNASEFKGSVFGNILIKGTVAKPDLFGSVVVKNGGFKVNYLNTIYTFSDRIYFFPDRVEVNNATLSDENGGKGLVEFARLNHKYFTDFYVDMKGQLNNFMVLNTTIKENNIYYGTGIFSGSVAIKGKFDDLLITANATTRKGTKLFIPLDQAEEVDVKSSYITFINPNEKSTGTDTVRKAVYSAIKMDFNLDITDEAYGEIVFDSKTGDVLKVNGSGKIKLVIDTRGDFTVIGQYNISKGAYHFTSFNLVNKDFDIRPGSTITWNGAVLDGLLDIYTQYQLNASLAPLLDGQIPPDAERELARRYPVLVKMRLTGNLLTPTINLGLEITDYPRTGFLNSFIPGFLAQLEADEQLRNQQVFSLLMFRMFTGSGLSTNAALGTGNTLSEMLSNQLSNWLSQVNENLEVSLDLGGLDQSSVNAFQLKFSYTLLEGRLRVTRDGTFTNAQNQTTAASIAGDWTLEYMLSKDGMYRAKMFHRANQNLDITSLNNNNTVQGASLMHTQSFDSFKELFRNRARKRKIKQFEKQQAAPVKEENLPQPNMSSGS
jgi:hypothetical protein